MKLFWGMLLTVLVTSVAQANTDIEKRIEDVMLGIYQKVIGKRKVTHKKDILYKDSVIKKFWIGRPQLMESRLNSRVCYHCSGIYSTRSGGKQKLVRAICPVVGGDRINCLDEMKSSNCTFAPATDSLKREVFLRFPLSTQISPVGCFKQSARWTKEFLRKKGYKRVPYSKSIHPIVRNSERPVNGEDCSNGFTFKVDKKKMKKAINYIDDQLSKGKPVTIGVSHSSRNWGPRGKNWFNRNGVTDHYLVIMGRVMGPNGRWRYLTSDTTIGWKRPPAFQYLSAKRRIQRRGYLELIDGKLVRPKIGGGWQKKWYVKQWYKKKNRDGTYKRVYGKKVYYRKPRNWDRIPAKRKGFMCSQTGKTRNRAFHLSEVVTYSKHFSKKRYELPGIN